MKSKPPIPDITLKELKRAIKQLKRGKSCGPDDIPNELFIEAHSGLLKAILKILNTIAKTYQIPEEWQEGEIKRLL